jgi:hypothetical protein
MTDEHLQAHLHENNLNSEVPASGEENVLQVGMVLLPNNLEVDQGMSALMPFQHPGKKRSAEGIRLWARHFAPCGNEDCIQVPLGWENFFIASLLNPSCFDWAKNFLSSEAWDVIIKDSQGDFSVPFSIPTKRKLECTLTEIDEERPEAEEMQTFDDVQIEQEEVTMVSFQEADPTFEVVQDPGLATPMAKISAAKISVSTSALHARRAASKAPLVVSDVRQCQA